MSPGNNNRFDEPLVIMDENAPTGISYGGNVVLNSPNIRDRNINTLVPQRIKTRR